MYKRKILTVEDWLITFPNRVWEPPSKGWASREATREDRDRRLAFANKMVDKALQSNNEAA